MLRLWGKGHPFTLMVGVETGGATMEVSVEVTQKMKSTTTVTQLDHSQEYAGRTVSQRTMEILAHPCLLLNYSP